MHKNRQLHASMPAASLRRGDSATNMHGPLLLSIIAAYLGVIDTDAMVITVSLYNKGQSNAAISLLARNKA